MKRKILLTGGSGNLGKHLIPLLEKEFKVYAPSSKVLDITNPKTIKGKYDLIVHCAAYTDVAKAEIDKDNCDKLNREGTINLLYKFYKTPFIFISSEYAMNPVNYYSNSKLIAEILVTLWSESYLIIQTMFKPRPWPFDVAYADQYTKGDYIDVIAWLIAKEIRSWDGTSKTIHLGTKRKTMFELAKQTNPNVKPNSIKDIKNVKIPADYE